MGYWSAEGQLCVKLAEAADDAYMVSNPVITAAGFNSASVRFSWQEGNSPYAFIIDTAGDLEICTITAPPGISGNLVNAASTRSRLEQRFRIGGALLLLLLALPLLGIGLFLSNTDRVADWAVKHIPPAHEAQLGDLVLAQTRLQMKLLDSGPAVAAVSAIGTKLTTGSVHRYRWYVAERPDVNAFAAPGGVVVVFSGLIRSAASAEELAGVLAHEVAHAELRHSLRGMVKSLGLRALVSLLSGDATGSVFTDAATRLTELRFSREAEREADADGLRRLLAARIDPKGMIRFYEKLADEKKLATPPLLSTHPASGERLERLRQEVARHKEDWLRLPIDFEAARAALR